MDVHRRECRHEEGTEQRQQHIGDRVGHGVADDRNGIARGGLGRLDCGVLAC